MTGPKNDGGKNNPLFLIMFSPYFLLCALLGVTFRGRQISHKKSEILEEMMEILLILKKSMIKEHLSARTELEISKKNCSNLTSGCLFVICHNKIDPHIDYISYGRRKITVPNH